jgi:hypothetical protein
MTSADLFLFADSRYLANGQGAPPPTSTTPREAVPFFIILERRAIEAAHLQ